MKLGHWWPCTGSSGSCIALVLAGRPLETFFLWHITICHRLCFIGKSLSSGMIYNRMKSRQSYIFSMAVVN